MVHRYGGPWSEVKLDAVIYYLAAYTKALRAQGFELWYFDGFAGTGNREAESLRGGILTGEPIEQVLITLDGSARRALRLNPGFHGHLFVERDRDRHSELLNIQSEFPAKTMRCVRGDANRTLKIVAEWIVRDRRRRGVAFLDPFSTEVEFTTLQALAATKQIDVWYLFNVGAVTRMLARRLSATVQSQAALDRMLSSQWRRLYDRQKDQPDLIVDLFRDERTDAKIKDHVRIATKQQIIQWFQSLLAKEFAFVSDPLPLVTGRAGNTLSLFLAIGNDKPTAIALARRLAADTIKKHSMR